MENNIIVEEDYSIILHIGEEKYESINFILGQILQNKKDIIHIFDCDDYKLNTSKKRKYLLDFISFNCDRIYYDNLDNDIYSNLENKLKNISENSYVFIMDTCNTLMKYIMDNTYFDKNDIMNKEVVWDYIAKYIYDKSKKYKIVLFISIDSNDNDMITSCFEKYNNPEITSIRSKDCSNEIVDLEKNLITKISEMELDSSINEIELVKLEIPEYMYIQLKSYAYIINGYKKEGMELLKLNKRIISNDYKIVLASTLIDYNDYDEAYTILSEMYDENNKDPNVLTYMAKTLLYINIDNDKFKYWINQFIENNNNDPIILEYLANYYNSLNCYKEASEYRRKLALILEEPFHELLARFLDLLGNLPQKERDASGYIKQLTLLYPELTNEANYRLGRLYLEEYNSPMFAYKSFLDVGLENGSDKVVEAAEKKLEILSDTEIASRALRKLKPYSKDSDASRLSKERIDQLITSIPVLTKKKTGYMDWKSFIEKTHINIVWENLISDKLVEIVGKIESINLKHLYEKSFINTHDEQNGYLEVLIGLKNLQCKSEEIENILKGFIGYYTIEKQNTRYCVWGRYYASIAYSLHGEYQKSNDLAISIIDISNCENQSINCEYRMLGLMAWGHSQYRLGNRVEGLLCIIASFNIAMYINEVGPLINEGLNILERFVLDKNHIINKKLINSLSKIIHNLTDENDYTYKVKILMMEKIGQKYI